jgi:Zn-dependent protease with chaperone function
MSQISAADPLEDPGARRRLIIRWLTGPWRAVQVLLTCMIRVVAGHAPEGKGGLLLLPVAASVAVVQLAHERAWLPLALVVGLGIVVVVNPLVNAAVSRRAELAADDYAAWAGRAEPLAALLRQRPDASHGCLAGLYAAHPATSRRVERLAAAQH